MANDLTDKAIISKHSTKDWLLKAITLIDLASLVGNETPEDIQELCEKVYVKHWKISSSCINNKSRVVITIIECFIQIKDYVLSNNRFEGNSIRSRGSCTILSSKTV